MSNKINDGGPAFPWHYGTAWHADRNEQLWTPGMTLRDYFAAAALQGMLAAGLDDEGRFCAESVEEAADYAYQQADAMLKERDRA